MLFSVAKALLILAVLLGAVGTAAAGMALGARFGGNRGVALGCLVTLVIWFVIGTAALAALDAWVSGG